MAKKQTRKSASLAAGVYAVAKEHAEARSISVSQLIEDALRAYGIPVPRGVHLDKATRSVVRPDREPVIETRLDLVTGDSFDRGETCAAPSRAEIDAMAAARRPPPPGTSCANCIDAPATHRGRVVRDGPEFWLCDDCELPDDTKENAPWKRRSA